MAAASGFGWRASCSRLYSRSVAAEMAGVGFVLSRARACVRGTERVADDGNGDGVPVTMMRR